MEASVTGQAKEAADNFVDAAQKFAQAAGDAVQEGGGAAVDAGRATAKTLVGAAITGLDIVSTALKGLQSQL